MSFRSIKQRLADGETVRLFALGQLAHPKIVEMLAMVGGFHGVWIDQEHADLPQSTIETLLLACRARDLDACVRVAPTDYAVLMRPMEAGARAVMAAQVNSVDEARRVVEWTRFPPAGKRGLNLFNVEADWGTADPAALVAAANRETLVSVQIETAAAVEAVDAIATVPGLDHLFLGPADLSLSLGVPGEYMHPLCRAAVQKIAAAAVAGGLSWGALTRNRDHAEFCRELGARLFVIGG
ncbi:MAG: HpcH/HpaI aldolase family protein, partial [Planctomycetia bacterium]